MSLYKLPNGAHLDLSEVIRIQPFPASKSIGERIPASVSITLRGGTYLQIEKLRSLRAAKDLADEVAAAVNNGKCVPIQQL